MAKRVKDLSAAGEVVEALLAAEHMTKRELANRLEISNTGLFSYLGNDIRLSTLGKILYVMGYELVFQKSEDAGSIRVITTDPCDRCKYKVFADTMDEAMELLHAHASEVGTEVDFYADEPRNKES